MRINTKFRNYTIGIKLESNLCCWPWAMARSSTKHSSSVPSLNGDPNLLQKMAKRDGFTRTCPEMTAKFLEKGEGFWTKHTCGLNADGVD